MQVAEETFVHPAAAPALVMAFPSFLLIAGTPLTFLASGITTPGGTAARDGTAEDRPT